MISKNWSGGGNAAFRQFMTQGSQSQIIVRRTAAIGDVLASTIVADKLIEQGHSVIFESNPMIHCVLRRHGRLADVRGAHTYAIGPHVNLDGCYENNPLRRQRHFHDLFMDKANQDLSRFGITLGPALNCCPEIHVTAIERQSALNKFGPYERPWVFVCPRSDYYACRQVPDGIWSEAAGKIAGTKFWVGRHPAPAGFIDLKADLDTIIVWLSIADLIVTVDTGPMHIGAALGIPILALGQASSPELHLSDQRDFTTIQPQGLDCLNCQKNVCPYNSNRPPCQKFDPAIIAQWANWKLRSKTHDSVSAIVPIYQPEAGTLNRCLDALLPQVDEIIVTMEGRSVMPADARQHSQIRYVRKSAEGIGYGRNVNFGARHSSNRWLLLVNDDVFLPDDAIQRLRQKTNDKIVMVVHQLRYPDGKIYPVAMGRRPGAKDFHHIDHRATASSINTDQEMENCCGASVLVKRDAFYKIKGFDEGFFIYCEDNDFAMRIRQAGYKILFTPDVCGIHVNGESTKKLGIAQQQMITMSGKRFHEKWDRYIDHNRLRFPGTFDYV